MSQVKTQRKSLQLEKPEKENSECNCYRMDINILHYNWKNWKKKILNVTATEWIKI